MNLPFPLRTLILDLDGCLIDSQEGIRESVTVAARETLPGHNLDLTKLRVGPPIKIMCARAFPELAEGDLQKLAQGYRAHYDTIGFKKTRVYPGGRPLLERCRAEGVAVDIATNKPRRAVDAILALLDLNGFFRSITTVDSVTPPFAGKTELLRHVCQINNIQRDGALYVGDTHEDRKAAEACGLEFALATYGYDAAAQHYRTIMRLGEIMSM